MAELDQLQAEGIVVPIKVSDWATPIVPVMKKDGTIRICGDYKLTLNQATQTKVHPLPRIDKLFASLSGGTIFSTLDLSHAYNQLQLDDKAQELTTINTHKVCINTQDFPLVGLCACNISTTDGDIAQRFTNDLHVYR